MQRYNPKEIEPKWQAKWAEDQTFRVEVDETKAKKYIIDMFPYPSGAAMHVGHVRNFTISDVLSQYHRQKGYNVLHTMGWDTFGLPAENYAIKTGTPPQETTKTNIANFKHQLTMLGMSYDWSREINTSSPEYYRWTQWIFTKLFEKGLAYQAERAQWWCDKCKTVLANEQVVNGKCWRHDDPDDPLVAKRLLKQWFFKITDYADSLLEGIDDLDWPEKIKTMQRNWIGKSTGAEVSFALAKETDGRRKNKDGREARESLKFTPELTELIKQGKKTNTVRLEAKNLVVGDVANLITRLSETEVSKSFAQAKITQVQRMKLADLPIDTPGHEAYASKEEQLLAYQGYYGKEVTLDDKFMVYDFEILDSSLLSHDSSDSEAITVFTTRPDTLFGATFMVLAPEHELVREITTPEQRDEIEAYITEAGKKSEIERQENKDKTGVFTGAYAINPANGEKVPIWVADYVLTGYGTGAIMAVPAHDERDHEFAEKFGLPIVRVVQNDAPDDAYSHEEGVMMNSGAYDGMLSQEVREKIVADLEAKGLAQEKTNYKMRDWLISRQRYWGAPIPIVYCAQDGPVAVPEDQLPVVLPEVKDFAPNGEGSVLSRQEDWMNTTCPTCGGPATRETDTMDGYACSSWYFLRYIDPHNNEQAWDPAKANYWLPVDYYCGGDHAVSHLLYSRFWFHFFADLGLIEKTRREPVGKLVYNGYILAYDGNKMSKSKGNTVNPDDLISQGYGADSVRLFEMFIAPYEQNTNWNTNGVPGTFRFLQRFWNLCAEYLQYSVDSRDKIQETRVEDESLRDDILRATHGVIKRVTASLDSLSFNTAVSALMECVNELYKLKVEDAFASQDAWRFALESVTQLLAPFAPHMSEELWEQFGHDSSVHFGTWPVFDEAYLTTDVVTYAIQINGKVRATVEVPADAEQTDVEEVARANERVQEYLAGKEVVKVIHVPGKLLSFVVK